jgi:hypothetical protein
MAQAPNKKRQRRKKKKKHNTGKQKSPTASLAIRRWEDNIKMDLHEVRWAGDMDWIDLAQSKGRWRALENAVMNIRVQYNAGNFMPS